MAINDLLNTLEGVKKTGANDWIARCSAHADKRASLTITEKDDGRVLIHCFAGCGAAEVLAACGLDFDALYPPKINGDSAKPIRRPWNPNSLLKIMAFEASVVALEALRISNGHATTPEDKQRMLLAHQRLQKAVGLIHG